MWEGTSRHETKGDTHECCTAEPARSSTYASKRRAPPSSFQSIGLVTQAVAHRRQKPRRPSRTAPPHSQRAGGILKPPGWSSHASLVFARSFCVGRAYRTRKFVKPATCKFARNDLDGEQPRRFPTAFGDAPGRSSVAAATVAPGCAAVRYGPSVRGRRSATLRDGTTALPPDERE